MFIVLVILRVNDVYNFDHKALIYTSGENMLMYHAYKNIHTVEYLQEYLRFSEWHKKHTLLYNDFIRCYENNTKRTKNNLWTGLSAFNRLLICLKVSTEENN